MVVARARMLCVIAPLALAAFASLALAACSGAGNEDLFEGTPSDTAGTLPTPTTKPGAPTTPTAPATPAKDAGPTPPPADGQCTQEREPNNESAKATPFTSGLCGKIDNNNDVDYGSFEAPMNVETISWKHSEKGGRATYRFFLLGGGIGQVQAIPGGKYVVQVRGSNGDRPTYEVNVAFK